MPDTLLSLRERWAIDVTELNDEEWTEALASPREVAIKSGFRLIQLKILHRVYYAQDTLVKMGRSNTMGCRRGCGHKGTIFHILWDCPLIQEYWVKIHDCMGEVLGDTLRPSPK